MVANVNKKNNKDNNRMIRIDERASNGQQAASKWTMGGMGLFTGRTLSTFVHDDFCQKDLELNCATSPPLIIWGGGHCLLLIDL